MNLATAKRRIWGTKAIKAGLAGTVGAVALAISLAVTTLPASAAYSYPGELGQMLSSTLAWNWYASPSGANTGCTPSSDHPYPVILTEGTFGNMYNSFGAVAPYLANAGYCVYTFNYGQTIWPSMFDAMGDIASSAQQLSDEVQSVLWQTGASQVDIVGWSQGGMMPRYYIDELGGDQYVNTLVALAPSNFGTTLDGITNLIDDLSLAGVAVALLSPWCTACYQQFQGSDFLNSLNNDWTGGVDPNVNYVNIESTVDGVISPYTNAFLSGSNVQNITLQNQCSQDDSSHLALPYDSNALQDVVNALGADDPNFQPSCSSTGWLFGDL